VSGELVRIVVNGAARDVPADTSVGVLLRYLELAGERVAVERNGKLVPRAERESTLLADGDRLEIVTLVGGG
jgi:sulfur carrier protein